MKKPSGDFLTKVKRAAILAVTCSLVTLAILALFRGNLRVGAPIAAVAVIALYFFIGHFG